MAAGRPDRRRRGARPRRRRCCSRCWWCRCRRCCWMRRSRCPSPLSVLILMVALFLVRPLDFTAFPQILLLSTLLRLALNVATTRTILTHGHEGPQAAGQVVAAFGGFLMGGDVVGRPDRLRHPAGGELHGRDQGLRPHRRGRGAVQPGRHARQADGDRRRPLLRPDRREGGAPPPPRAGGGKRLLRRHGRRREVRPRRRHRRPHHHRRSTCRRPRHRRAAARPADRRGRDDLLHADGGRWSRQPDPRPAGLGRRRHRRDQGRRREPPTR